MQLCTVLDKLSKHEAAVCIAAVMARPGLLDSMDFCCGERQWQFRLVAIDVGVKSARSTAKCSYRSHCRTRCNNLLGSCTTDLQGNIGFAAAAEPSSRQLDSAFAGASMCEHLMFHMSGPQSADRGHVLMP